MFHNRIVTTTRIKAGNGGTGSCATVLIRKAPTWAGGDGGSGGDIIFQASDSIFLPTLNCTYRAQQGCNGRRNNKNGKAGLDTIIYLSKYSCIEILTPNDIYEKFYYIHDDIKFQLRGARGGVGSFMSKGNAKCGNHTSMYQVKVTAILKNIIVLTFNNMWEEYSAFCKQYTNGINCKNYAMYTYNKQTVVITNFLDEGLAHLIETNACPHILVTHEAIVFQNKETTYKDFYDLCNLVHSLVKFI